MTTSSTSATLRMTSSASPAGVAAMTAIMMIMDTITTKGEATTTMMIMGTITTTGRNLFLRCPTTRQPFLTASRPGDVTQTSAVLWARAGHTGKVTFQVATDADFRHIIDVVTVNVGNTLVPAKVEVDGLHPHQRYYYRAVDASGHMAEGTLETSAKLGQHVGFAFGAAGDLQGELAPYPSIKNAPTAGLDLFVKLGDIPYADASSPVYPLAQTLQEFEAKNNEIYSSHLGINSWAALQSTTPIHAVIDDDEVANDLAGGALASLILAICRPGHLCQRYPPVSKRGDRVRAVQRDADEGLLRHRRSTV